MIHILQKPWGKWLCIGLILRQNISKLKFKPTLNFVKNIKTFVVSYTKRKKKKYYDFFELFWAVKNLGKRWDLFCLIKTVFSKISIEESNRIISDDFDLSEEFSTFFEDAARLFDVKPDEYYLSDKENLSDPVVWKPSKCSSY